MIRIPLMHSAALALALAATASPAAAQNGMVQAINPDADRLAQTMRTLAADPRDLTALIEAGRLSTRLNDMSAALAFFQRAESVSPSDPRIAAGRAAVLVRKERPGEALRLFQSAEARGASMRDYAADRGFAYDLLGQPGLAQADYKLAMQRERDDELVRRYALSLGISGQADEASVLLDPLLRRSDRAAWRARAFILAMNGDIAGAEKIAGSMMGAMGPSLAPFFRRLGSLSAADRAFAVHFGELSPTQARLADARLAPVLPRYVAEQRPVQVAARQAPAAQSRTRDRRSARDRGRGEPVAVAAATPAPAPAPVARAARPTAPGPVFAQQRTPVVQPLPTPTPTPAAPATAQPVPAAPAFAQRSPIVQPVPAPTAAAPVSTAAAAVPAPSPVAASPAATPAASVPSPASAPVQLASTVAPASTVPPVVQAAPAALQPQTAPSPVQTAEAPPPTPAAAVSPEAVETRVPAARPEPAPPGPARVGQEDSVLAAIVANLTIPAAELEAANSMALRAPVPDVTPPPAPAPVAEAPKLAEKPEPVKAPPVRKPEPAKAIAKAEKDKASAKAEKGAKGGKAADAKTKPATKPDPERVWVQVAGGANAGDLAKAWKAVAAKAPAQLKGKSAWWTPVRASNRLLTGPFKTSAEGQAFVNTLAKAGVSGFVFTSQAGQKVSKIGEK